MTADRTNFLWATLGQCNGRRNTSTLRALDGRRDWRRGFLPCLVAHVSLSTPLWIARLLAAFVSLVVMMASLPVLASDARVSGASGVGCEPVADQASENRVCAGPGGYSAVITHRGNVMQISFGRTSNLVFQLDDADSTLIWRGTVPYIGKRIEWRMQRGKLLTAIVRIFTLHPDGRPLQQFFGHESDAVR